MSARIDREKLERWADYLLDYSLDGITTDDVVMIKGEHVVWPLISVLEDKVFAAGGIADVHLVPPNNDRGRVWSSSMARHGTPEQVERVPDWQRRRYEAMTKYVEVLGAESPELFSGLPDEMQAAIARVDDPIRNIRLLKPWVLTLYPTEGFAAMEGMSLAEYTDVILAASLEDPRRLEQIERPIAEQMRRSRVMRIETTHPDDGRCLVLEMSIAGRNIIPCTGKRNFPDGEVFTSPDARSVEGEIFVDKPVFYGGTTIEGVYLRFSGGVIEEYRARCGHDALAKIIETDRGSRRLGEVALGMNAGMKTVLRHPLFVEKVGGTLHIAIGASYPECFVDDPASDEGRRQADAFFESGELNRSAQHVDIVTDFRPGGAGRRVLLDDVELAVRDGIWVVP